jgi:hypothetical protein
LPSNSRPLWHTIQMPKLPPSWKLKTKRRLDGKLDILGKDDLGSEYRVRTTDGPEVTDKDITELRAADREAYPDRTTGARAFVDGLVADGKRKEQAREDAFAEDMTEAAGPVSFALLDRKGHSSPFTGSTRAFREGWEKAFGGN